MTERDIPFVLVLFGTLVALGGIIIGGSRRVSSRTSRRLTFWGQALGGLCLLSAFVLLSQGRPSRLIGIAVTVGVGAVVLSLASRVVLTLMGRLFDRKRNCHDDSVDP